MAMQGKDSGPPLDSTALFYMSLLALQFGMQPILTRRFTGPVIIRSSVILVQESIKFCLAAFMLLRSGVRINNWTISQWVQVAMVPAGLYALQNIAALTAYQNLDALSFNVLNQTKTLSAALCCYLIMDRKQSLMQIVALLILLTSALVMEKIIPLSGSMDFAINTSQWDARHWTHGVAPILLASFISGLAGALSQKNLQSAGGGRNPYLFSMELCAASSLVLVASLLVTKDGVKIQEDGFFYGWTPSTLIPIVTNSVGGIIVGLVTKFAGSVRKGFALIFGILLSGLIQQYAASEASSHVRLEQVVGGLLAALSLWIHATCPPKPAAAATTVSTKKED